jgi:hypothetical protein
MRLLPCVLFAVACAGPAPLPLAPQVPPLTDTARPADPTRDGAPRAAADRSPPNLLLERSPEAVTHVGYRSVVQVVEVPTPVAQSDRSGDDGNWRDEAYRYADRQWQRQRSRRGWFPINTAVGAGVGAIIGHQSGRRGRGALLGASTGLLFDFQRLWW